MSSNTIYLWEPEIFTGKVPTEDEAYEVTCVLHEQYRHTPIHGNTLRAWLDLFAHKICDPHYQHYFSEQTRQWIQDLKDKFERDIHAIIQLEPFEQHEAIYRVLYETVHSSGVGLYEPNYNVWAVGALQSPKNGVENMLQPYLLQPLEVAVLEEEQLIENEPVIENKPAQLLRIPINMADAELMVSEWLQQQRYTYTMKPYIFNIAHDFISKWGNLEHPELAADTGYRCFLLTQQQKGVFYQLKMVIRKLNITPMLSFAMDFTDHFIPKHLQEQLPERLIFRLRSMDIHQTNAFNKRDEICFPLTGRWDTLAEIENFFHHLDGYINFIFTHLGEAKLETLQAWAYGDLPENIVIDVDFRFRMMMMALSQDEEYLEEYYQKQKQLLAKNQARAHEMSLLEESHHFCQKLIYLVGVEGTALKAYS